MDLEFLDDEQNWLSKQVHIPKEYQNFKSSEILFGIDVQYVEEDAYVAVSAYHFDGTRINNFVFKTVAGMNYVPGYFCFREGPPILRTIRKILSKTNIIPSLMIIDGHGLAHPRKFGVACFVGLKTNIPTIGIAKKALLQYDGDLTPNRGDSLPILLNQKRVGAVVRTQNETKPVFVSPGYKVSIEQSIDIALDVSPQYRLANPIRLADKVARNFAKGNGLDDVIKL